MPQNVLLLLLLHLLCVFSIHGESYSLPFISPLVKHFGKSFQLAIITTRVNLFVYDIATAQNYPQNMRENVYSHHIHFDNFFASIYNYSMSGARQRPLGQQIFTIRYEVMAL